jgi:hypothetical protein
MLKVPELVRWVLLQVLRPKVLAPEKSLLRVRVLVV